MCVCHIKGGMECVNNTTNYMLCLQSITMDTSVSPLSNAAVV